jgi:hypothetical protein
MVHMQLIRYYSAAFIAHTLCIYHCVKASAEIVQDVLIGLQVEHVEARWMKETR